MSDINIKIPDSASYVIRTLRNAGFEAFIVGGCVRDALLGKMPDDWDITTSALPMDVKKLFRRTVDTGIQHGTVTVLIKNDSYEVTTYRIDGVYEDSRHPKDVSFTANINEDLKRRDFTINAMAYDKEAGLIDLFGGLSDLEKGIVRCVGNPTERFTEDALRIMRAIRFSAQLGFTIEEKTVGSMKELAGNLSKISAERIQTELVKLLVSDHPEKIREAWEYGITSVILPEFDLCMKTPQNHPHHMYGVGEHIIHSMINSEKDRVIRLSMLFHDMGKPLCHSVDKDGIDHFHGHSAKSRELCKKILRRLKFDNNTIDKVSKLVEFHDVNPELNKKSIRRLLNKLGKELFIPYLKVKEADTLAQSDYKRGEKLEKLVIIRNLYDEIISDKECFSIKDLAVNGNDLINQAGIPKGKEVGEALNKLLDMVIEDPSVNKKDILLERLKEK